MRTEHKVYLAATLGVLLAVAAIWLLPEAVERLSPAPRRAWVAIQVAGSPLAEVGPVELEAGTKFELQAVLEAESVGGDPVYYTEAERLSFGGEEVPPEQLRRWDRQGRVQVLWFSVEGNVPFMKLEREADLERFTPTEFLHLGWPRSWTVPGRLEPANDDGFEGGGGALPFGTQRYHARIEIYAEPGAVVPATRFKSPGATELVADPESFTTAFSRLPGARGPASLYFGLTSLEAPPEASTSFLSEASRLTRAHLAYVQLPLLAELLRQAGRSPGELDWKRIDLAAGSAWGRDAMPGDLVQVGARWVMLHRDEGVLGELDREDLCLDFEGRPAVRRLAEVFTGEGELELARLYP